MKRYFYLAIIIIFSGVFSIKAYSQQNPDNLVKARDIISDVKTVEIETYPNPFSTEANFKFTLDEKADVELEIYNILGGKVKTLHSSVLEEGSYHFKWDGSSQSNGIYFYKFSVGRGTETGRLILRR